VLGVLVVGWGGGKLLSDKQWKRYARNAPNFSIELRPKVRKGDQLPWAMVEKAARVGNNARLYARITSPFAGEGELIKPRRKDEGHGYMGWGLSSSGGGRGMRLMALDAKAVAAAAPGPRTTAFDIEIEIRETRGENQPVLAKWTERMTAPLELVSADAKTVEIIDDPSLRPAMEKALSVRSVGYRRNDQNHISLEVDIKNPPAPIAYKLFIRTPEGREESMSSINAAGSTGWYTGGWTKQRITSPTVDVIFRPSAEVARNTVGMTRMWNGEIVIKNVPFKLSGAN
jgi:hypothetical protein